MSLYLFENYINFFFLLFDCSVGALLETEFSQMEIFFHFCKYYI